ncbi:MAG: endolytic transglycosylase MltG [Patescibacteria group bacterium]
MQQDMRTDPYSNYDKDFVHMPDEQKVPPIAPMKSTPEPQHKISVWRVVLSTILAGVLIISAGILYVYYAFNTAVQPEVTPTIVDIPPGASLQKVTNILDDSNLIASPFLFRTSMIMGGLESSIKSGEYTFSKPIVMAEMIERIVKGKYEYVPVRLIIREGENAHTVAESMATLFPKLSTTTTAIELAKREGKLFPETYMFAPFATLEEIVTTIDTEYEKRIARFRSDIASSTHTELEILTIASILENEVPEKNDMKMVAGIIYNRLKDSMPLQMDSTVGYITNKASLELTLDDLKIDSPYNTYAYKGLPPGPIGNPGDVSIEAALHPSVHQYIFFLSDADGVNHYAKTYKEHLNNRKVYLGK